MQAFVPKNRRPKFELRLKIVDLNNVPLVSGTSYIKWHLPSSISAEHRGYTPKATIKDHKVAWEYEKSLPVKLTVDKNGMLQESEIHFEVLQEYSAGGKGERIILGHVRLNLSEYVEGGDGDGDEGITRRYLMQGSKINSTLKICVGMKQTEGDRNFVAPPLRSAPVFGGIAGIMSSEQTEPDDPGHIPLLHSRTRENGEMQDMYRRTLASSWAAQVGELPADQCIENIFAGGSGWRSKDELPTASHAGDDLDEGDDSASYSDREPQRHHRRQVSDSRGPSKAVNGRVRSSSGPLSKESGSDSAGSGSNRRSGRFSSTSWRIFEQLYDSIASPNNLDAGSSAFELGRMSEINASHVYSTLSQLDLLDDAPRERGRASSRPLRLRGDGRWRGFRPREETATLGKPSLGTPSEVIILHETDRSARVGNPPSLASIEPSESHSLSAQDLLGSVKAERGLAEENEVQQNLHKLLPHDAGLELSRAEFERLAKTIYDGFTTKQLQAFLEKARQRPLPLASQANQDLHTGLDASEWTPGVTPFGKGGKGKAKPLARSGRTLKHRLVSELLRSGWGLRIKAEEGVGELEIKFPPREISLLLSERRALLQTLAEKRNARIDVSRSRGIVRVTADQSTSSHVLRDIGKILGNARSMEIDLGPLRPSTQDDSSGTDVVDTAVMNAIIHVTGTVFEWAEDKSKLVIHSLGSRDAEDARRLLLTSLPTPAVNQAYVLCAGAPKSRGLLYSATSLHGLDWNQRRRHWQRLQYATPKPHALDAGTPALAGVDHDGEHQRILSELKDLFHLAPSADLDTVYQTYAVLGQVLHESSRPSTSTSTTVQKLLERRAGNRSFSYSAPGISQFALDLRLVQPLPTEHLIIRAVPSPWELADGDLGNPPPPLEIVVNVDAVTQEPQLDSVYAIMKESLADLMLPHRAADVRFVHRCYRPVTGPEAARGIAQFFADSQLNIKGRGYLRTPTTLRVKVPRWTSLPMESVESATDGANDEVEVEYLFAGLDHRQTVELEYDGMRAQYISIEAGRTGGRRCELRLLMEAASASEETEVDETEVDGALSDALGTSSPPTPPPAPPLPSFDSLYQTATRLVDNLPREFTDPPPILRRELK
ncbi:MAG: hypothetical protein M1838_000902 [Thelocarpon superellum]|nr:MAG: hypothetical protein M1838_000902 [Thelocarpon superellum]